jgi:hypothetical protein
VAAALVCLTTAHALGFNEQASYTYHCEAAVECTPLRENDVSAARFYQITSLWETNMTEVQESQMKTHMANPGQWLIQFSNAEQTIVLLDVTGALQ